MNFEIILDITSKPVSVSTAVVTNDRKLRGLKQHCSLTTLEPEVQRGQQNCFPSGDSRTETVLCFFRLLVVVSSFAASSLGSPSAAAFYSDHAESSPSHFPFLHNRILNVLCAGQELMILLTFNFFHYFIYLVSVCIFMCGCAL